MKKRQQKSWRNKIECPVVKKNPEKQNNYNKSQLNLYKSKEKCTKKMAKEKYYLFTGKPYKMNFNYFIIHKSSFFSAKNSNKTNPPPKPATKTPQSPPQNPLMPASRYFLNTT